jgi:hypothetical protein
MVEAKAPAAGGIQDLVEQELIRKLDAQSKCLVTELELKGGQSGCVDEGDELQLRAPGIVCSRRVVEPQAKNAIPGDSPSRKDFEGLACLRAEALNGIPEQGSDAHGESPGG